MTIHTDDAGQGPGAPDGDEQAIRAILRMRGVSHGDAAAPPDPVGTAVAAAAAEIAHPHPQADAHPSAHPGGDWWDALYGDGAPDTHAPVTGAHPGTGASAHPAAPEEDVEKTDTHPDAHPGDRPWWARRAPAPAPAPAPVDGDEVDDGDDPTVAFDDEEDDAADAHPRRTPGAHSRSRLPQRMRTPAARPAQVTGAPIAAPAPRMSLLDAAANVPPRVRWLALHLSAAAVGYDIGIVQFSTRFAAWIADNGLLNVTGVTWCCCGVAAEFLRHRFARYRLPIRWVAAIPISSIVIGTLLYGQGWQHLELPL